MVGSRRKVNFEVSGIGSALVRNVRFNRLILGLIVIFIVIIFVPYRVLSRRIVSIVKPQVLKWILTGNPLGGGESGLDSGRNVSWIYLTDPECFSPR
jgi:hypothetical protein